VLVDATGSVDDPPDLKPKHDSFFSRFEPVHDGQAIA